VIGAIVFGATYGLRHVWFLGTDGAGRVTLYRGVPYELPFGIKLYSEHYSIPIQTESLPERRQDAVTGHDLRSRSDATDLIEEIERTQEKAAAREEAAAEPSEPTTPAAPETKTEAENRKSGVEPGGVSANQGQGAKRTQGAK
jgi:hypothetical protein